MKTISQTLNLVSDGLPFFQAEWPAPANVKTLVSTRNGGVSQAPYSSLNVGGHVGDRPENVARNREIVQAAVPVLPAADVAGSTPEADASFDRTGRAACAVMTADCLPVLLCDRAGTVVAAAHAGWRGLAGGILQNTVAAMQADPGEIMAYLGPAIGPDAFEVGEDVREAFCRLHSAAENAFEGIGGGKYLADIYALARQTLRRKGVNLIYGGTHCTVLERDTFFSYRRDGQTGRMVSMIWLEKPADEAV